ncbi:ABC transporter ATP-binding protein [Polaribacter cellanae]|uniref:ABC transporter ATP-binding protein n=1 Tax=Polaribacter cellanae TaxID=2818493 RepID=A0A975H6R5_9FLAO|nr:ABC transporter ATP-binding protein [Polaribacter cellanae]QTE22712.1 ABC transporter ATP-binding protein [Polaribacter cellanae]
MLEAKDLTKKYGNFTALDTLNLSIRAGDIFCLLGANGAGKSTTINLFLNFIEPSSGKAFVNGLDVEKNPRKTKQWLSYIPENLQLYQNMTGLENLRFFCGLQGGNQNKEELEALLIQSGLQKDFVLKRVSSYSKGMRQKVGVALARAKGAKILLLDEPTSGLDPKASNEFSELLLEMKEQKVATLMTTHDLFRAKDTGTHIGIMKGGVLVDKMESSQVSFQDLEQKYLRHMHT